MRFLHMADMHMDAPFTVLNTRGNLGEKRRLEQREIFKKIIEYIQVNQIEYLFIAGDLYEHEYIRETTIKYINELFQKIPNTKIYITPGNHDPYIQNSMYKNYQWNDNVTIFSSHIEIIENEDVDIYGFGFDDFYCKNSGIENIEIRNREKINILITHGTLNGGNITNLEYNPLDKNRLIEKGFDYIALGHIHIPDYCHEENQRIVYPGSTMALGFDELGEHGVIVGNVDKENVNLTFLEFDNKQFEEIRLDITDIESVEELIEKINQLSIKTNTFYKIILEGKRNFEINLYYVYQFISNPNIIKIKDQTKINVDIEKISQESNLKGLFIKEILNDVKDMKISPEMSEKIVEIGLETLEK